MPDGEDPKKKKFATTKAPILSKYDRAEKFTGDPTKQGYKQQETIAGKTYYDKEAEKAISGGIPGADWEKKIQQMAASGVSPEELVKAGHISPSQIEKFRPYYKAVYTEPETVVPKTTAIDPAIGQRNAFRMETPLTATQDYISWTKPNKNGQVNISENVYTDKDGNVYDSNDFLSGKRTLSGKNIKDERADSFRSDAQGATNLPTQINGVPVVGNTTGYVDPLLMKPKGDKQGTVNNSGSDGYKKGGLVKKIKGYANGGGIDPEFQTFDNTNPALATGASTGANMVVPGSGIAIQAGLQGKDALVNQLSQIDPTTGKYKNKNAAYGAGLVNAAYNATPLGMAQTALDPNKDIGEKALSIGTFGIADLIKSKKGVDNMQNANVGILSDAKMKEAQAQKDAQQQSSLSKQLLDRSQGLANGGKIEGKGSGTSDSITAKIKENSFVVPAKNAAEAELVRKVVLKAPITKANLNQGNGTKVNVSDGEHLFTEKEVDKIESKGVNLDALAPDAKKPLNDDKQKLVRQKELLGLKDGGNLAEAMKSGNKTTPKKVPTYYSKKAAAEKVVPDYLESMTPDREILVKPKENTYMGQPFETNDLYKNRTPEETMALNNTSTPITSTNTGGNFDMAKLGNIAESAIPFLQAGYGLSQLRKQGKRPVGELDKDYLKSIGAAKTNLDLANAQAKYGFTSEESALLNQENQNLTNAQRYAARNLSGGSAGNAFNLERSAINNSFGRGLKAAVENRQLMLQKQGIAGDKQAYLDNLIANKAQMSRQLFNDKMNAFQQNQSAGAGLLGAGLNNLIQGKRYQDELAAMKNTQGIRNNTYGTLGQ